MHPRRAEPAMLRVVRHFRRTAISVSTSAIAAVFLVSACGSQHEAAKTSGPSRTPAPARLVRAATWLNNHSDGNVLWSARAEASAPRLCGAGFSASNPDVVIVRTVSRRGQWAEVSLNTSTSEATTREGFSYADDFNSQTPEEIVAGSWRCSFFSPFAHAAYDHIKFDGGRNPAAPPVDPVSRVASGVAHEEINGCRQSASGIDGAVYACTEAWSGKEATVNINSAGDLTRVSLPDGRIYRP